MIFQLPKCASRTSTLTASAFAFVIVTRYAADDELLYHRCGAAREERGRYGNAWLDREAAGKLVDVSFTDSFFRYFELVLCGCHLSSHQPSRGPFFRRRGGRTRAPYGPRD